MEWNEDFDDDLDLLEIVEFGFPRQLYVRNNPYEDWADLTFFRRFRIYKQTAQYVLGMIQPELEYPNDLLNNSVSPMNQLLTCLRVYATGGHLSSVSDIFNLDVSTASRIVPRVANAIARLAPQFIEMPDQNAIVREQTNFFNIVRFPKVIGAVDGTHIRIQSPGGDDAEIFRNRKNYFSINTQLTCNAGNAELKIIDIVARWPGSTHDSTMFINSNLRAQFETGNFPNSFLLGDSGYPLRNYFLTPLLNPNGPGEQLYNEALIRTRISVERTIGLWKRRFLILAYGARLKLETMLTNIVATAVLHNIAIEINEPEPQPPEHMDIDELNFLIDLGQIVLGEPRGNQIPQHNQRTIINYFSNL